MANNKKRKITGVIVILLIFTIVGSVVGYMRYRATHIITDDAFVEGDIHYVTPQIPGKVAEVLVKDNDYVEKGQVLVKLDTTDIEAELTAAKRNLEVVKNQIAGQYASLDVINAQINQLSAQRELLQTDQQRLEALLQKGAIPQSDLDKVNAQLKAVNAQIKAAQKQKRQIKMSIGKKGENGKEAGILLAEARIAQVELQLQHTVITAPISGYITRKNVNVGQVVQAGQPLMAVVSLDNLYITANYKETELTNVRPGQKVVFKVDTYPGVKFNGRVESIMAGTGSAFSILPPQNATGNYIKVVQRIPVKIAILDYDKNKYPLRIGMSVVPVIYTEEQ